MVGVPRFLLWLAAITFVAMGVAFLLWPLPLAALVELRLDRPTAQIDFGATYGGFQFGFGVFLVICARRRERTRLGLLAAGWGLAGYALGRLYSLAAATGGPQPIIYGFLAIELSGATIAFWAAHAHNN